MKLYGLIGYPLTHSLSAKYFEEKFQRDTISGCRYEVMEMQTVSNLHSIILQLKSLSGLNVTIPFKQEVISFLDELDNTAKKIGAVNCVMISRKKETLRLKGFNTDAWGFEKTLLPLLKPFHTKALILGSGGGSKAVRFILDKHGIGHLTVSRNPSGKGQISYNKIDDEIMKKYLLIINTTPVGMFPDTEQYPEIPYQFASSHHLFYDLVYNPEETLFLKKGKERGANIKNGLEMLYLQAEKSWEIWNKG